MTAGIALPQEEPIYIECCALLEEHLTGIGRFTARAIEAIARRTPVILFTNLELGAAVRKMPVAPPYWGSEILVDRATLAAIGPIDEDVGAWARKLMRRGKRPSDPAAMRRAAAIYPVLRPLYRAFRKEIGVFYDFTTVLLPWAHAPETAQHFDTLFNVTAPLFDSVVAISQSTKDDAGWLSTIDNDRVVVGYPGPSLCDHGHRHNAKDKESAGSGNVILAVSSLEPRKNAPFLIEWFAKTEAVEPGTQLLWVGAKSWWASDAWFTELRDMAQSSGKTVQLLGAVSDSELCRLYRSAAVSIYPSLYEGFGLPVLDSLRHGTPALVSFNSSLAEFETEGVFYFDPGDAATLDDAYRQFLKQRPNIKINIAALNAKYSWNGLAEIFLRLAA